MNVKKAFFALFFPLVLCSLLCAACSTAPVQSSAGNTIKIATKPMTEQFILGEMLQMVIEEYTPLNAEITKGIGGGTGNIHPALLKGDFDLYPEYTSTAWQYVLKHSDIPDEQTLYAQLLQEYQDQFQLDWVGMYGFSDTFGIAVRSEVAEQYQLTSYSDLAAVPGLVFGAEYDFYEREDGYDALCQTYGLQFEKTVDLDIGLKYQAINAGEIDVMDIFTTDGQLSTADVVVLLDDKAFFLPAYCGTVIRSDTLAAHPELKEVLMKLDGILSTQEMTQMNYEVEQNMRDEREVAKEFLSKKGIIT